ncbi:MAG: T9SS type A sorting domain-containing protein [Bacteroidetes bacterium]|nr:T9SS type A sorting domain-containing protein [Bacteroidota bacterium]
MFFRRHTVLLIVALLFRTGAYAHTGPSINGSNLPNDYQHISSYTPYIDSSNLYIQSGYQIGNTVGDFTLFDSSSHATQLSALLAQGKPVMVISMSLSCPASRHSLVYVLPDVVAMYGSQVNFLVVYVLEAHPVTPDVSPYSNTVWTTQLNYNDSILIRQETNYLQRKSEAEDLIHLYRPSCPLLIDQPGNEYWRNFGPAPNNAYLINTDGVVYSKYGWFDQSKQQIVIDIASLLSATGISSSQASESIKLFPNPAQGNFNIQTGFDGNWSISIIDISGRIIWREENIPEKNIVVPAGEFAEGVYSVRVNGPDKTTVLRFVRSGN